MDKKGMSMAIEIFIILFVLLAVAMLVLRLVTEQSEQQVRIIQEEIRQQQLKKIKADCQSACKCDSLQDKVGYCLSLIKKGQPGEGQLDITGDGFTSSFAEPPETGGLFGVCEDRLYCSQLTTCTCENQNLTMKNCFRLICSLWGTEQADVQNLMARFFPLPTCEPPTGYEGRHWSYVYALDMLCGLA